MVIVLQGDLELWPGEGLEHECSYLELQLDALARGDLLLICQSEAVDVLQAAGWQVRESCELKIKIDLRILCPHHNLYMCTRKWSKRLIIGGGRVK